MKHRIPTRDDSFAWRQSRLDWPIVTDVGQGLDGVIASTTKICWLDPSSGLLAYRGIPIEELAVFPDFESTAHLLIRGRAEGGLEHFKNVLRESRQLPLEVIALIRDQPRETHPTRLLRAAVSALGCHEMTAVDDLDGRRHWRELRIVGQVAALLGEIIAHRQGRACPKIDPDTSLAQALLEILNSKSPSKEELTALNLLWVLYAAHGMDAPTFTSMVVASCHADPYTNIVAGLSAMRGPLQGGTGEQVLQQLLALRDPEHARQWTQNEIDKGRRIAGFGHRMYRMPDPRVVLLRKSAASLARHLGREDLFAITRTVEFEATRKLTGKGIHVNINFYAALLFYLLGAEGALVPCLFAVARTAGLVALVHESLDTIRLHRPLVTYVGQGDRTFEQ